MAWPGASDPTDARSTTTTRLLLGVICVVAAVLRFTGLAWGAPYFHFHMDEHFVFTGAEALRQSIHTAAMGVKFFMYGPLPMWTLNAIRAIYERVWGPLVLTHNADEITLMVMGRAISAVCGTLCVPLVYLVAKRIAGRVAGLIAALLLACAVVQLRESHFFSVDTMMLVLVVASWLFAMRVAEGGRLLDYVLAGAFAGAATACKYTALFMLPVIGVAHLCAPGRPRLRADWRAWALWVARGVTPIAAGALTFAAADPVIIQYWDRARPDIDYWVVQVNNGTWKPIFMAQFRDIQPQLFWFTNVLWWGLGPAFEMTGLIGVGWLLWRRDRRSIVAAAFPIAYYAAVGQGIGPFMRYGAPLAVGLAVPAAVLCADWLQRPRWRTVAVALVLVLCGSTGMYAAAYMNVFRSPDVRLTTADWMVANIPRDAHILVEPTHNLPPTGQYRTGQIDFGGNYTTFGGDEHDYYWLHPLDTYRYLYDKAPNDMARFNYIQERLAKADWIVMDDTYLQFYQHLPTTEFGVVKRYYRDLFAGRLGFQLVKTFKVYPKLFGVEINDDAAELSGRLFDHPRMFVFMRTTPIPR